MLKILHARLQHYANQNFQIPKRGLEKEEELEIKLPHSLDYRENKGVSEKRLSLFSSTTLKPLCGSWQTVKALREIRIPGHLYCLLRNLYMGQEATVRTLYGTTDWFKIKKGVWQGCLLSPCLYNLYLSTLWEMPDWMSYKLESRYADDTTLMAESEEELKSLLMKVKEESEA